MKWTSKRCQVAVHRYVVDNDSDCLSKSIIDNFFNKKLSEYFIRGPSILDEFGKSTSPYEQKQKKDSALGTVYLLKVICSWSKTYILAAKASVDFSLFEISSVLAIMVYIVFIFASMQSVSLFTAFLWHSTLSAAIDDIFGGNRIQLSLFIFHTILCNYFPYVQNNKMMSTYRMQQIAQILSQPIDIGSQVLCLDFNVVQCVCINLWHRR